MKSIVEMIVTTILLVLFGPALAFCLCYAMSWIACLMIGNLLSAGLALVGIQIAASQLPLAISAVYTVIWMITSKSISTRYIDEKE